MLKKTLLITITFYLFDTSVFAEIFKTDAIACIKTKIAQADENTLVIFDVDDVLIVGKDQARHTHYNDFISKECLNIMSHYSEEEAFKLFSIMWQQAKSKLVNPEIVSLIKELNKRNVKVIALTNAWTGRFGHINSIEQWRVDELKSLGIDFSKSFPNIQYTVYTNSLI